jgi:ring-1,2-phenylacetyl-CoA epoxidase subunit PaaD
MVKPAATTSGSCAIQPSSPTPSLEALWQALENVSDPEIPVVSVIELGIVRSLEWDEIDPATLVVASRPPIPVARTEIIAADISVRLWTRA